MAIDHHHKISNLIVLRHLYLNSIILDEGTKLDLGEETKEMLDLAGIVIDLGAEEEWEEA